LSLLAFILAAICLWQSLKLRVTRRLIGDILDAGAAGRPILIEQRGGIAGRFGLDRLMDLFNRLITENITISEGGRNYLERMQQTLGKLREAVVMVDSKSVVCLANPAFTKLVNGEESPLGKRLDLFLQGEDFHEFLHGVRVSGEGRRTELEVEIGQKARWLEVSASPMGNTTETGNSYTLFVFHDVTRQKGLEKMRTEFVANVSHELRTPVTVIKGFAETLIEDDSILTGAERTRFLKKIYANSERLHNLLQDLLLLTRLESTGMILSVEDISLSGFIHELSDTWETVFEEAGKSFRLNLCKGNDLVRVDPLRLSQVVNNLIDNVRRHAHGYSYVELQTSLEEDGIHLRIKDDGQGIPSKDLPHIFQRFYRVDKGRSRESGGTGLGLSIVKHIVVQHGGDISATSEAGQGTLIDIRLPYPVDGIKRAVTD
jgi:signal transduction histidine kinase